MKPELSVLQSSPGREGFTRDLPVLTHTFPSCHSLAVYRDWECSALSRCCQVWGAAKSAFQACSVLLAVPFPSSTGLVPVWLLDIQIIAAGQDLKKVIWENTVEEKTCEDGQCSFITQFCSLSFSDVREFLYNTGKDLEVISG